MPGLDWLPGVSQLKSTVQLLTGDVEGAMQTQENFLKECPGVSQVTSTVQLIAGDAEGALETQKRCLGTVNNFANGIPVVGHVKGVVHYIAGDEEGGDRAMNAATRSTVVIGSGAVAGLTTGGIAAIPAGIAAGAVYDTAGTLITDRPQGLIAAIDHAVKDPNAGNIFEAAFVPVGDGLGGYAGGRLANTVATQIRLSNLQAARAAKMGQLDAAIFSENQMSSAQALALGDQINSLTSQINIIERGTPQYWFDTKSGQVVTEAPASNTAIAVPGYIDEKDEKKAEQLVRNAYAKQSDAILSDYYGEQECAGNYNTTTDKINKLDDYKQQKANDNIKQAYLNVPVLTEQDVRDLKQEQRDPNNRSSLKLFQATSWLSVPMPAHFNYTGAILRNFVHRGLFHSLLRHSAEWQQVIPGFQTILQGISSIQQSLRDIGSAPTPEVAHQRLHNFETHQRLSNADRETLSDLQMQIYQFLRSNITSANYLGEGVNTYGRQQVYFEVTDINGRTQVMVVCVSEQLYRPDPNFNDSRPIRTITTVFFIPKKICEKRLIKKLFEK